MQLQISAHEIEEGGASTTTIFRDGRRAYVAYDDLREWIVEAEKLGELVRADGYSWQQDIGMAAELLQHLSLIHI